MKPTPSVVMIAAALCCAATQAQRAPQTVPQAAQSGVIVGTGYYQNVKVCLDLNANGRCDAGEPATTSAADGSFTLPGSGALVAEVGTTATVFVPVTSSVTPVTRPLTFRGPAAAPAVLGPVSTELQALMDANGGDFAGARASLSARLGVAPAQLVADPFRLDEREAFAALQRESGQVLDRIAEATAEGGDIVRGLRNRLALDGITTVVVIYAENRSFDGLYGLFPGANGVNTAQARAIKQLDRDAQTMLPILPPAWGGLTAAGQTPVVTQAQTTNVWPNGLFQIDATGDPYGYGSLNGRTVTRDLYHRFFENAMQINGGKNDMYVAWADAGGLVMGYFDGSGSRLWNLAAHYTLADNFFQAAYGGSFLNHQYLACACVPSVPAATVAANGMSVNVLGPSVAGVPQLVANASQQASALNGPTSFKTGNIAPLDYFGTGDGYRAVNTRQPAYQPSGNKPVDNVANHALYATPTAATTLPPQTQTTVGDLLSAKGLAWTWYSGGWAAASATPYPYNSATGTFGTSTTIYNTNGSGTADAGHADFQAHHQPFNYFANLDPGTHAADRAAHLKDRAELLAQAQAGSLPPVVFYKPVGYQNQHPGYANVSDGDDEIAATIAALQAGPQWQHMLILVTYDEFGGQFDHVAPPKGDAVGPGTRIPALLISPFAKKGYIDHTQYDTASFLRFVTHRWSLPVLPGLALRDGGLVAHGGKPMGDLTNALSF